MATISLAYALGFVGIERKTQVVKASNSSKAFTHVVNKASLESVGAEIYSSSEGFSSDDEIIGNEKKAEVVRKAEVVVSSNSFSSFQDNLKLSLEKEPKSRPKNVRTFAKQLSKELGAQGIQSVVYARGPDGTTGFHARESLESEHSVKAPTSVSALQANGNKIFSTQCISPTPALSSHVPERNSEWQLENNCQGIKLIPVELLQN